MLATARALLKDTPQLTQAQKLQGWFIFAELERARCLEAWQAFYKLYKEDCKTKGKKKLIWHEMQEVARGAYTAFSQSFNALMKGLTQLLECANGLSGVQALRQLVSNSHNGKVDLYIYCDEKALEKLLSLKDALGAVVSQDAKVLETKKTLEQKITACQEELPKYLALLDQATDKSWQERNQIKAPFERLTKNLGQDIQALFEACDASLGVEVMRQVLGVEKASRADNYDESGFKSALEKQVLKPLEECFKTLGLALEPQIALNMLKTWLQDVIAQITKSLGALDQTYKQLAKEGIVSKEEIDALYKSLDQGLEPLKESLKAFVAGSEDENIAKMGAEALNNVGSVRYLEKSLPLIESMLKASNVSPQSEAMVSTRELKALKARQNMTNLKVYYQAFKELWAQYKPLEDQQERQKQVFKAKRQVLCDLLDYEPLEVLNLYRWNIEDKDTKEALDKCYRDWMVEKYDVPDLGTYQKDRQKFQDKLNGFSRGVADLLASSPKLTEPERLKGWWHYIELKRLDCQKAYSTFVQLYKEECKTKGKKSIGYRNIEGEAKEAWDALQSRLNYSFPDDLKRMLQYTARVSGVGRLRKLIGEYTAAYQRRNFSENENDFKKQLLEFQEAMACIESIDDKVIEAKGVLEQGMSQCQEKLQECNTLLGQEGLTWEQKRQVKKPFEEACGGLIVKARDLLEAVDVSLGVAPARQALDTLANKARDGKTYNTPAFQKFLEDEVLKPLEQRFLSFKETPNLQIALDAFKSILQNALQEITKASLDLEPTYQQLQAEGFVDTNLCSQLKEGMDAQAKALGEGVDHLLKVLDESATQVLKKAWDDFNGWWWGWRRGKKALAQMGRFLAL
ncbi:hypothetical protein NHP21005_19240 (plasmid) [Helicobacter sp. NHP21005]|uniref:hypothetical protein n=1 Tax=Helicobacter felistomachi TaxID=3040201 RepID=UPI002572CA46|nr:hypothetical protein [Helicobacter sp. NHP21005]BEG58236.1 hypothetical protein NHP21005_19240 [Helicobacter sp. NHP21005]